MLDSKLVSFRFRIERKCIKVGARETRRASIHKLEVEKNIAFHPKRDRAKSVPFMNMNLQLKSLRDAKEDRLIAKSRVDGEILAADYEPRALVNEYNSNDMGRDLVPKPYRMLVRSSPRKKWIRLNDGNYLRSLEDLPLCRDGNDEK